MSFINAERVTQLALKFKKKVFLAGIATTINEPYGVFLSRRIIDVQLVVKAQKCSALAFDYCADLNKAAGGVSPKLTRIF